MHYNKSINTEIKSPHYKEWIGNRKILKSDHEISLLSNPNEENRAELIKFYFKTIYNQATRFAKYDSAADFDDFISSGIIGLNKAIDKWDSAKINKFATYAIIWIRAMMFELYRNNIRQFDIPAHAFTNLKKTIALNQEFLNKYSRNIEYEELAAALDIEKADAVTLIDLLKNHVSLNPLASHENPIELRASPGSKGDAFSTFSYQCSKQHYDLEATNPDYILQQQDDFERLKENIQKLDDVSAKTVILKNGLNNHESHTFNQISTKLKMPVPKCRHIYYQALKKLKFMLKER